MLLSQLADARTVLAATRSRNAKRDIIAAVLASASAEDVEIVVGYLSGTLRQRRTGIGWKALSKVPAPAESAVLSVVEVDAAFERAASLSGSGSVSQRARIVDELFGAATSAEQSLLRGLISGEMRQGALESAVQDGLATAYGVPLTSVRRAAMLLSSTAAAARVLVDGGLAALEAVTLQVGTAVQPMLAASAPDPRAALERTGMPALVDHKLDGVRVQVHRDGDRVRIFTRSLDDITTRLPDVVAVARALPVQSAVLDGEVLALRSDGRPEAFQVVASRAMSVELPPSPATSGRLRVFFFDLLHVDGADLLDAPLAERAARMQELLPADCVVPRLSIDSEEALTEVFQQAVGAGFEGVVVKNPTSAYAAGRRDAGWVKLKPRHTFDLVVTAVEWGHGRRRGWLSNLHLAAQDANTGGWVMLGKTFKGMTDEMLAWQTEHFLSLATERSAWAVQVQPSTVVEIACDGLQRSTRYPGGVALRFARVLRYRTDKSADEADTLDTVKALSPTVDGADADLDV